MNNGGSSKCQTKSKTSKKLKEDSDEETAEHKQVPESENPKTDAKEDKGSHGTSDKKCKKEKSIVCCKKCKAKMKKKLKEEESDEEDVKQKQKTDSNEEKGSKGTSDAKDEKEKGIVLTWRHKSTKKEKGHGKNLSSVNPPYQTARSMYHGGPNLSNQWNMYAPPRVLYPAFAKGPMYGQCGGGPFQPYQNMNPAAMYRGALMSPYPPMAAAMYPPYWQSRPFTDANPITRYTTYHDNYSYFYI